MNDIKCSLTIIIPGRQMYNKVHTERVRKGKTEYNPNKTEENILDISKNRHKREIIVFRTRKCIPAKQVVNISTDNYFAMIATPIGGYPSKKWNKMTPESRTELHMQKLAEGLGGTILEYTVFE